jgi:hypothetical protein
MEHGFDLVEVWTAQSTLWGIICTAWEILSIPFPLQ